MSNQNVGELYGLIINKIIAACVDDFETHAYSQEMLMELKKKWQQNLSKMKVAQMPWDPPPINIATGAGPSSAGTAVAPQATESSSNGGKIKPEVKPDVKPEFKPEPHVKQEIKYENDMSRYPNYSAGGLNPQAADRASQLLQQRFGSQANASLQAAGLPTQPRGGLPGQHSQQRPPQPGSQNSNLNNSQMDGAIDWSGIVDQSRSGSDHRRSALDRVLESTAFESQQEGTSASDDSKQFTFISLEPLTLRQGNPQKRPRIGHLDGNDGDDEDAINSDLDDDDDDDAQNIADDGSQGEMILCLWDKVNRVKSKWKCTLKDGILSTGGKEYLFQKASGEFEW